MELCFLAQLTNLETEWLAVFNSGI